MKKSQSITLTFVAAMGMAARAQQSPATPASQGGVTTCEERRAAAKAAGIKFRESCHVTGAHGGTSRGMLGSTASGVSAGT
jgi:hypothetical protein